MSSAPDAIVDLLLALDPMADLPRTGWLLRGVRPCESLADHSFGVAVVVMMLVDAMRDEGVEIDGERAIKMALLHDVAESKTGDIPMPNKTPKVDEALHELEAVLARELLPPRQLALWHEAEARSTLEARIVKAADKIQMMIKVLAYERAGRGYLEEFWNNPKNFDACGLPVARAVFARIAERGRRPLPGGLDGR